MGHEMSNDYRDNQRVFVFSFLSKPLPSQVPLVNSALSYSPIFNASRELSALGAEYSFPSYHLTLSSRLAVHVERSLQIYFCMQESCMRTESNLMV